MLHADIRQDFQRFLLGGLDTIDADEVDAVLDGLHPQATAALAAEGVGEQDAVFDRSLDLRYAGQLSSIRVTLGGDRFERGEARTHFESEYERLYGHLQPNGTITITSARVTGRASTGPLQPTAPIGSVTAPTPIETRKVFHGPSGWLDTPVYRGLDLGPGEAVAGPAVIEEVTTTVLVGADDRLTVDDGGNFVIDLHERASAHTTAEAPAAAAAATSSVTGLDPIVLALMQHRLDQISRHVGWVMTRTASSPIFSQSHDFSCFVAAPDGTLVANADGIPIHTGGGGFAVRALLRAYEGRIKQGDVFLLSDPYVADGNHLPDWVITRPAFATDADGTTRLAGFCCNRAHQADIGGGLAGTYNPEATEIWQAGIRLPVMKLTDRDELRYDLWQLLLINSRTADLLDGDLRAMLGSTQIGLERVESLVSELGLDPYLGYLGGICDHADRRFREAIAALPDGRYEAVERSDNDCFGPADVHVDVAVTVAGDQLTVDFTGTCDQIRGFKNSSLANTYSAVYVGLSSFFDPDLPRNEGAHRAVEIVAPEGSVLNARPPAPMTMNTVFVAWEIVHAVWEIVHAVWTALAQADPQRACAGWGKTMHGHVAGTRPDGRTWVMYQWHAMGTGGATSNRDGFPQIGHLISLGGLDLPNLEFHEQLYPVHYRRWELRCDAAGAGERRGGTGVHYEADMTAAAIWSFRAEGMDTPTGYGVLGGLDGAAGQEWIVPANTALDGESFVPRKYGVRRLAGHGRMIALTPGGGGWGDPHRRPPETVLRDVRDGVVSVDAARLVYGVVPGLDDRHVDEAAAGAARA